MKILAIMGSPRKGVCYDVTQRFRERLSKHGDVEFEYLFLKDTKLELCRGCNACITNGEAYCPIKDDRDSIIEKIDEADAVVFVSPVYYFNISALMKNLFERISYLGHRPRFFNKPAMGIAVCASGTGLKPTLQTLSLSAGFGFSFVCRLGVTIHHSLEPSEKFKNKMDKNIELAANKFYNAVNSKEKLIRSILFIFSFEALKKNAILAKDCFSADYEYYRARECYDDTRMTFFKRLFAAFVRRMVGSFMKRNYKT